MDNFTDIFKNLRTQDKETRLYFYDRLGFNLTIAIRSIWSNPDSSDKEKIDRIKIINELSHRIYNWTWRLKRDDLTFDDLDCASDIKNYADQNRILAGEIGEAVRSSYRHVTNG